LSHRNDLSKQFRLSSRQTEDLQFVVLDAAEQNQGLGCDNYVQCAKKICDNPKFSGEIDAIFGSGVPSHYRHILLGKIIDDMIKAHLMTSDEEGIYAISGTLLESTA
jgi:hypothetical protein